MKIAVTGHTQGIGKAIFDYFSQDNQVEGFSRSNGFNIKIPTARQQIVELSKDFDIFVNNAYNSYDDAQLLMLTAIAEQWRDTDKLIINISSRYTNNLNDPYCQTKKQLDDFCEQRVYDRPYILNIKPGITDTPRVAKENKQKMSVNEIITVIDFALLHKDKFRVHNISFGI
jgi:NAD(P)-dependent dehydrogenase (short-subunit alcohol dehydrogenase family)